MSPFTATLHPEGFHGRGRTRRFFEGWYVKLVSKDLSARWAVIPGVFLGPDGDGEAFVQVLDGATRRSWYHRVPLGDFRAEAGSFDVRVAGCHFSPEGIAKAVMPKIRNNITLLLSSKKASELLPKEGKEQLAEALKDEINGVIEPPKKNKKP